MLRNVFIVFHCRERRDIGYGYEDHTAIMRQHTRFWIQLWFLLVLISFVICNQLLSTCKSMSFHIGWKYCRYAKVQVEKLENVVQFLHLHSEV